MATRSIPCRLAARGAWRPLHNAPSLFVRSRRSSRQRASVQWHLRDRPELRFETLLDLCGVDYSAYGGEPADFADFGSDATPPEHLTARRSGCRFAVVYHLLSLAHNWRLRVRAFAPDDEFPVVPSVIDIWPSANWYEREAFDFFGIIFAGQSRPAADPTDMAYRPTLSARTFRCPVTSRCATTPSRAGNLSPVTSSRARSRRGLSARRTTRRTRDSSRADDVAEIRNYTMNFGPQHPGARRAAAGLSSTAR